MIFRYNTEIDKGKEFKDLQKIIKFIKTEDYETFKAHLLEFWENYKQRPEDKTKNEIDTINLNFFGEGLTSALVFRANVKLINDTGESFIKVLKYDLTENIIKEASNYSSVDRQDKQIFAGIESDRVRDFLDGKSILSMKSVIDSKEAKSSYTIITFILDKYEHKNEPLFYYAKEISDALVKVFNAMEATFYMPQNKERHISDKMLKEYFAGKIDTDRLNEKSLTHMDSYFKSIEEIKDIISVNDNDYEAFCELVNDVVNTKTILSSHAIHGDFNPNNILFAVSGENDISPMIIDFLEMKFFKKNEFVPFYYDFARLECEIIIRYFYYILQKDKCSLKPLLSNLYQFLKVLNDGKFLLLESLNRDIISDNSLNYIFRILYNLRRRIFQNTGDVKSAYINYCYASMAFLFFYLKFEKEEGIENKKAISLLSALFYRNHLNNLKEVNFEKLYKPSKMEIMDLKKTISLIVEKYTSDSYVIMENELLEVIEAINSRVKHILIQGRPGTGKSHFSCYLTRLLNQDCLAPDVIKNINLDNMYCIPYFTREQQKDYDLLKFFEKKLKNLFPLSEMEQSDIDKEDIPVEKFKTLLRMISQKYLIKNNIQVIFLFDGLNEYRGSIEDFLRSDMPSSFTAIYTTRSNQENILDLFNDEPLKSNMKSIDLKMFNYEDIEKYLLKRNINLSKEKIEKILEKSQGLQIYLSLLVSDLSKNPDMDIVSIPNDLNGLYNKIIDEKINNSEEGYAVLFTLALAKDYLSFEQLCSINEDYINTPVIEDTINRGIILIGDFIEKNEAGQVRIFHQTVSDYVKDKYSRTIEKKYKERWIKYLKDYKKYKKESYDFEYCLNYLGIHFYKWGLYNELKDLLSEIFNMPEEEYIIYKTISIELILQVIRNKIKETDHLKDIINYITNKFKNKRLINFLFFIGSLIIHFNYWFYWFFDKVTEISPENHEAWTNKGLGLNNQGRYEEAINCFNEALKIDKEDILAWNNKGCAFINQGRTEEAIKCFDKSLNIDIKFIRAWTNKGCAFINQGRTEEAIKCFDEALNIDNEDTLSWPNIGLINQGEIYDKAIIWYNKGNVLHSQKKYNEAIKCFDKAIEIDHEFKHALYNKGSIFLNQQKYTEAIKHFDKAIKIDPKLKEAWNGKGKALLNEEKYGKAIKCFDEALNINPKDEDSWNCKGIALNDQGKYNEAIKCFDKAIEIDPKFELAIKNRKEANLLLSSEEDQNNTNKIDWMNKGENLTNSGKYDEAIKCFDKAIEIDHKDKAAYYKKGKILSLQRKYNKAIKCFDKAIEIDPKDKDSWNEKGINLLIQGNHEEAIKCFDKIIKITPKDKDGWNNKGVTLNNQGKYAEAIKCYDKAIEIDPKFQGAWCNKGNALVTQEKYDKAIKCYDELLAIEQKNKDYWDKKGNILLIQGKYEKAIKCFDKALNIDSKFKSALNNKGNALNIQEKYDDAIKYYDKAIEVDPDLKEPWYNKGNALNIQEKYDDAIKCYDKAIEIDPKFKEALVKREEAKLFLSEQSNINIIEPDNKENVLDKTIKYLNKTLDIDPENLLSLCQKGVLFFAQGKYEEAIECFDKTLKIDPTSLIALDKKGDVLFMQEKYAKAINYYNKVLNINPKLKDTWNNKGNALRIQGKYAEAIECFDKAIKIDPKLKDAWNNKGITFFEQKNYIDAIKCYDKAIKIAPEFIYAWNNKGNALFEKGNYIEAIKCYDKAIKIDPKFKGAIENKIKTNLLLSEKNQNNIPENNKENPNSLSQKLHKFFF